MEYKFWKSDQSPLQEMCTAYDKVEGAKACYDEVCKTHGITKDPAMEAKHGQAKQVVEITNTEEYLARHLKEGSSAAESKIRNRLDQFLELFQYDEICPAIRKVVFDVTGL